MRVSISILLGYVSLLVRFVSAFIFSVVVIRSLSPDDFSVWVFGFSILSLFSVGYDLWGWVFARRYALGVLSSLYAGMILNTVYAVSSSILLLALSEYLYSYLGSQFIYISLFVFNLSLNALVSLASYTSSTLRPDVYLSSALVFEISRVTVAYIMIRVARLGLEGAILSPALASIISSLYILYLLQRSNLLHIEKRDLWRETKNILKISVAGLVGSVANTLWNLDRILLTIIARVFETVSFLGVGYSLRNIISQITSIPATTAYAKLLEDREYPVRNILMISLVISIPSLGIMMVLVKPLVSLLNPAYISASNIVAIMLVDGFIVSLANLFISIATGFDRRDLYIQSLRELFETSVARVRVANMIRAFIFALSSLIYSLGVYIGLIPRDPLKIMLFVVVTLLVLSISYLIFSVREMLRFVRIDLRKRDLYPIIVSLTPALLYLILTRSYDIVISSVWRDLSLLVFHTIISLGIYVLILYATSDWFRYFLRRYLRYLL